MKRTLISIFLLLSTVVQADFQTASELYASGDYENAYNKFLTMAKTGEKQSQFNLGVMYYQGQFVTRDINKAYAWIKLAANSDTLTISEQDALARVEAEVADLKTSEAEYQLLEKQYSTQALIASLYPEFVSPKNKNAFNAEPVKIIQPKYPRKAAINGQQGWVRFLIDVDKKGSPRNIQLLEDFPKKVFSRASQKAISKWRFKIAYDDNGQAISRKNLVYTMQFKLQGAGPTQLRKGIYEKNMKLALKGNPMAQFNIGYWEKKLNISKGEVNPNEWFLKSAVKGNPLAQYELGKSLVFGQGCKLDKAKGVEWLTRSAHNGQPDAKQLLAEVASRVNTLKSQSKAVDYIEGIEDLSTTAKLNFAWMFATSPFKEITNPKKALDMIDDISYLNFKDDITIYELKAAAYASMDKYKKAVSYQEDALQKAEYLGADTDKIKHNLAYYKQGKRYQKL